jgi:hypothetical protein
VFTPTEDPVITFLKNNLKKTPLEMKHSIIIFMKKIFISSSFYDNFSQTEALTLPFTVPKNGKDLTQMG